MSERWYILNGVADCLADFKSKNKVPAEFAFINKISNMLTKCC